MNLFLFRKPLYHFVQSSETALTSACHIMVKPSASCGPIFTQFTSTSESQQHCWTSAPLSDERVLHLKTSKNCMQPAYTAIDQSILFEMPRAAIEIGASDGIRLLLTIVSRQFSASERQRGAFNAENAALSRCLYRLGLKAFSLKWIAPFQTRFQRNGGM